MAGLFDGAALGDQVDQQGAGLAGHLGQVGEDLRLGLATLLTIERDELVAGALDLVRLAHQDGEHELAGEGVRVGTSPLPQVRGDPQDQKEYDESG